MTHITCLVYMLFRGKRSWTPYGNVNLSIRPGGNKKEEKKTKTGEDSNYPLVVPRNVTDIGRETKQIQKQKQRN
jgi:hypothetical protein